MWLLQGLQPCYKTITDFRRNHPAALRSAHKEFIGLCQELELVGGEQVAVDGSFFHGNVSQKSFITQKGLKAELEQLDRELAHWLEQLDELDRQEEVEPQLRGDVTAKLEQLKILQETKSAQHKQLVVSGVTQHSRVDSDARLLHKRSQKVVGYNVQIVVDAYKKLIVADEVVSDLNDLQQLYPMAEQTKQRLGVATLEVLADAGYYSASQLAKCQTNGITAYVPIPKRKGYQQGRYTREQFRYDQEADVYYCPANHKLNRHSASRVKGGSTLHRYSCSETHCMACKQRRRCITEKSRSREVWRNDNDNVLHEHHQRIQDNPQKLKLRSAIVEHPFGTLKRRAGWDHFMIRGIEKVRGEWSLMALCYNFTRVLNIIGIDKFRKRCEHWAKKRLLRNMRCLGIVRSYISVFFVSVILLPLNKTEKSTCTSLVV